MRDGSEVQVVYLLKPGKKSQANMAMQQFSGLGYLHKNMLLCGIGKYLWIYEAQQDPNIDAACGHYFAGGSET